MTLQVLLSAMNLADYQFINRLNIKSDAIVINQCDNDFVKKILPEDDAQKRMVTFISSSDRGLSKSRNLAINEASADVCIFCDNDVIYEDNAKQTIIDAFSRNPEADVIVFFIKRPERSKPVFKREKDLGYNGAMRIFSPEIAFRTASIKKANLYMNEQFGAGARYGMGEENIFLFEAIGKGLTVKYVPIQIAHIMDENDKEKSTWFKGYDDEFFINRGANYYAMTSRWYWLLILQFAIRKQKLYRTDNPSMMHVIRVMFKSASQYAKENK